MNLKKHFLILTKYYKSHKDTAKIESELKARGYQVELEYLIMGDKRIVAGKWGTAEHLLPLSRQFRDKGWAIEMKRLTNYK